MDYTPSLARRLGWLRPNMAISGEGWQLGIATPRPAYLELPYALGTSYPESAEAPRRDSVVRRTRTPSVGVSLSPALYEPFYDSACAPKLP
jgi:hypothetical protein